jgi:hypothetical protein
MEDSKYEWEKFPLSTCKCFGMQGNIARDCYARTFGTRIQRGRIPYPKPGDKPLTRKERQRIRRMEDKFELEALEISLGLQAYDPNFLHLIQSSCNQSNMSNNVLDVTNLVTKQWTALGYALYMH